MTGQLSQLFVSLIVVALLVLLWQARHQQFARIGDSWHALLAGLAFVSVGEFLILVLPVLAQEGIVADGTSELLVTAGHVCVVAGLLIVAYGVYHWLTAAQSILTDSQTAIQRDIDLRKRIARDGMLLSTIPAALYRTSGSLTGGASNIVFVNDKIEELLGYSVDEFAADPMLFHNLMHSDDQRRFAAERTNLWNKEHIVIEHRFRHKNGEYRWIRRHLKQVRRDSGEHAEWHGCAFDITDLKQAEGRLLNFLDAAPDALIAIRDDGAIVMANTPATLLFGYREAELLGLPVHALLPEESGAGGGRRILDYFGDKSIELMDFGRDRFALRKDGTTFPAEIRLSPLGSEGEPIVICCVRDMTALKETEAQLRQAQKMQSVGQLTGGIAHDFNNMLTVVIGNLQLLERTAIENPAQVQSVQAAMDASMRAAELVKRLLAFSRRQLLAPKNTRINKLITELEPLLRQTLAEDIGLKTRLADDLWLARIDPSQLENALINLALNARDALDSGGQLTIETANTILDELYTTQNSDVTPGEYVQISVSDNGRGISKRDLPNVFEPFYTTKEVGKGSGLGLSMVYGFVKQSQGHIKIYSEEGHGTTIKIYIPRSDAAHQDRVEQTLRNKVIPGGDETILLVEDEDGVRDVAISLLSSIGYDVLHADCGSRALEIISERDDIDLLFTDIVMPGGMNGTELAQLALEKNPKLRVLYTSGYTGTTVFDNELLEHGSEMLNKPYRQEELAQSVRNVLDRDKIHDT